jgi:hypothetical protein
LKAEQENRRASFEKVAEDRYAEIVASGKAIPWPDMRAYRQARVRGKTPTRPIAKRLAGRLPGLT